MSNPLKKLKICKNCCKEIPLDQFVKNDGNYSPRGHKCFDCYSQIEREKYQSYISRGKLLASFFDKNGDYIKDKDYDTLSWDRDQLTQALYSQSEMCLYCNTRLKTGLFDVPEFRDFPKLNMEHMEALSNGGEDEPWNIALSCGPCNSRKGRLLYKDWLKNLDSISSERAKSYYILKRGDSPEKFYSGKNDVTITVSLSFWTMLKAIVTSFFNIINPKPKVKESSFRHGGLEYFWFKAKTGNSKKIHFAFASDLDEFKSSDLEQGICGSIIDSSGFEIVSKPIKQDVCKKCLKNGDPAIEELQEYFPLIEE